MQIQLVRKAYTPQKNLISLHQHFNSKSVNVWFSRSDCLICFLR